jgi:hypothetical protein
VGIAVFTFTVINNSELSKEIVFTSLAYFEIREINVIERRDESHVYMKHADGELLEWQI